MLTRLATALVLATATTSFALAEAAPTSTDACLKLTIDLAKSAQEKKLAEAKLNSIEDMLSKLEGHCDASQFGDAANVAKDIRSAIAGS